MLKAFVIGNLGKDAVVNRLDNGSTVINFSVAHTEKFTDKQGTKQQKTTWVEAAWWTDKTAIVPYLVKGASVFLEGIPEIKTFAKQDGTTGTSFVLRVGACQLLGGGNANSNGGAQQQQAQQQVKETYSQGTVDDLPF